MVYYPNDIRKSDRLRNIRELHTLKFINCSLNKIIKHKRIMKKITLIVFMTLFSYCKSQVEKPAVNTSKIRKKAQKALLYCKQKNMNTDYCILVDMSVHSGLYRLFIWDFKQNKIVKKSLVSHGCGENSWGLDETKENVKFSNTPDSHCSSKGKYKIGKRAYSQWGIHIKYWLHGLDQTNSNALKRIIVLHSWDRVTEKENFPNGTAEGWGCPAVSNKTMRYLDKRLKHSKKPVLFWIFE